MYVDAKLGKLNLNSILLDGHGLEWVRPFRSYGTLKSGKSHI